MRLEQLIIETRHAREDSSTGMKLYAYLRHQKPQGFASLFTAKKLSSTCFGASEEDSGKDQPSPSLVLHTQSQAQRTQLGIAVFFKIKKLSPLLLFESSG